MSAYYDDKPHFYREKGLFGDYTFEVFRLADKCKFKDLISKGSLPTNGVWTSKEGSKKIPAGRP